MDSPDIYTCLLRLSARWPRGRGIILGGRIREFMKSVTQIIFINLFSWLFVGHNLLWTHGVIEGIKLVKDLVGVSKSGNSCWCSSYATNYYTKNSYQNFSLKSLIDDRRNYVRYFRWIRLLHVYREANCYTDGLTRPGRDGQDPGMFVALNPSYFSSCSFQFGWDVGLCCLDILWISCLRKIQESLRIWHHPINFDHYVRYFKYEV